MMYLYNNEIKNKNIRQLNQLTQNIFEKDCWFLTFSVVQESFLSNQKSYDSSLRWMYQDFYQYQKYHWDKGLDLRIIQLEFVILTLELPWV